MTIEEYYRELLKYAIGWLGWSEQEALFADVNSILIGVEGRVDLLNGLFGKSKKEKTAKDLPMAQRFKLFSQDHNAIFARKKKRDR